ncbi:hypothetical protein B0A54_18068 [Friedmanniomyces endolithicus]|uniref:Uncharacterized protein n=1 Tax=Friedmanniomyces endolithicus TaxID=329885 RepID=A0A4U0TJ49_9PEZI|nr:hypothetical protein B0A54_18068 [Friedmanniomyces endolithicus]
MAAFPALQSTAGARPSKDQADKSAHSDEDRNDQRNKTADKRYAIIHGYPGYYTPLMRRVLAEGLSLEQANHRLMSWAFGERSIIPHKTVADLYFGGACESPWDFDCLSGTTEMRFGLNGEIRVAAWPLERTNAWGVLVVVECTDLGMCAGYAVPSGEIEEPHDYNDHSDRNPISIWDKCF